MLYQLMKSGLNDGKGRYERSRLFEYFHALPVPIGNEKAWLKRTEIGLIRRKPTTPGGHWHVVQSSSGLSSGYRYVRALLGIGDTIRFLDTAGALDKYDKSVNGGATLTVNVSCRNKEIERCASPILFKIIKQHLFILPYRPHPLIHDQKFEFRSKLGRGTIDTPSRDMFSMVTFMEKFVDYVNEPSKLKELRNGMRVNFIGSIIKAGAKAGDTVAES